MGGSGKAELGMASPFLAILWPDTCNFIKRETPKHVLFCKFCEAFKSTFFTEHHRRTIVSVFGFDYYFFCLIYLVATVSQIRKMIAATIFSMLKSFCTAIKNFLLIFHVSAFKLKSFVVMVNLLGIFFKFRF